MAAPFIASLRQPQIHRRLPEQLPPRFSSSEARSPLRHLSLMPWTTTPTTESHQRAPSLALPLPSRAHAQSAVIPNHSEPHRREENGLDFLMGGAAAVMPKTGAAPVERVKLLLQNQGEMMKRGHLMKPYNRIGDCFSRVVIEEGFFCLWRGIRPMLSDIFQLMPLTLHSGDTSKVSLDAQRRKMDMLSGLQAM